LTPQRIKAPLSATDKEGIIDEMLNVLEASGDITDRDRARQAVLEREHTRTTGIGDGLALPHGKTGAASKLVMAVGVSPAGVDFNSIDGKPVQLVVMLIGPREQTGEQIQALARIARIMSNDQFRKKLISLDTSQRIFDAIKEKESEPL